MSRRSYMTVSAALVSAPAQASTHPTRGDEEGPGTTAATSSFHDGATCTGWMFNMEPWTDWSGSSHRRTTSSPSMAVGARIRVIVYEHVDHGGSSWSFDNLNGYAVCVNVPWWMDNKTSSIRTRGL